MRNLGLRRSEWVPNWTAHSVYLYLPHRKRGGSTGLRCVHCSFPQLRYTDSEVRVKSSMATRKFYFKKKKKKRSETQQQAVHTQAKCSLIQKASCTYNPTPSRQPPPTQFPPNMSPLQLWAWRGGGWVKSALFTVANLVLGTEETLKPCLLNNCMNQ